MKLNILIATIDDGIKRVGAVLLDPLPDVSYCISHQVTAEEHRLIPEELKRVDVKVKQLEGRGISRNRNSSLGMADGDIALLSDDDVCYKEVYFKNIIQAFAADEKMDVACFKIATPATEEEYKDYSEDRYTLNEESRHYISSIEIALRLSAIREKEVVFDERFGLGSAFAVVGEEAVFVYDCIRAGLLVKYLPQYVVEHPATSTTAAQPEYGRVRARFKGAYDAHRYGWKALAAAFRDTMLHGSKIRAQGQAPLAYLYERLSGAFYSYFNKRNKR